MVIEIFKAGTWTDANGNTRTWTEEDLDEIVEKYNSSEHEAPVVIGHPKDNSPAYGWVESLERKGGVLYAKLKDLVPEFVEWVKKGLYKKRSISLYPDLTLRHVGFLGAMPPAVKGLRDVQFTEVENDIVIEFEETEREKAKEADEEVKIITKRMLNAAKRHGIQVDEEKKWSFKEDEMEKITELEQMLKEKERLLVEFEEREKQREAEIKMLREELNRRIGEQRKAEFKAFCEGLITEGKLTPAQMNVVIDFMEILHSVAEYEFSEGDKKVRALPVERFKEFLKMLPKQIEFSEIATKDRAVAVSDEERIITAMASVSKKGGN